MQEMEHPFGFEPSEDILPIPVITKNQLVEANQWAINVGYNRAVEIAPLEKLLDNYSEDIRFPILLSILHEHRAGEPCEPHMRCQIVLGPTGPKILVDVDMDLFERLDRVSLED
jgi:hypothetical protein